MLGDYEPLDSDFSDGSGLRLTPGDTANLRNAGKWARFISVFGMVILGFVIFILVVFGGTLLTFAGMNANSAGLGAFMSVLIVVYGGFFALSFYLIYLQFAFGKKAMEAVDRQNPVALGESLSSLARFYRITGVILVVYLGFMALSLLTVLLSGASALLG